MSKIDPKILSTINTHKNHLYKEFEIESLSIFGSSARGDDKPASDIDILVRYKNTPGIFGFLGLKEYLEKILEKPVDLVTEGALKPQLKNAILKEAERVA